MLGLFRPSYVNDLNAPLLHLSRRDAWTVRDALDGGVQVFGSTGSGKTSGSGKALATAFLRAGWGGLVLCAKPDEADRWQAYCKALGRSQSFIRFDGSGARRFNFLDYEMARQEDATSLTHNLVQMLLTILDGAEGRVGGGSGEDAFWRSSSSELLSHALDLLWSAYGRVSLSDLIELIQSRPMSPEQATHAKFQAGSFWAKTVFKARTAPTHTLPDAQFRMVFNYFVHVLAQPDQKTSGNIIATLSARLSPLLKGKLHDLFATTTNLVPELTHEGAIIVVDLPVKEWAEAGVLAAHIWKYLWQRATERRRVNRRTRPVFCWADECQFFLSPYDTEFVSTSRSQRACTVYLTQNLPTYYARIQARNPQDVADSLLGNFSTKIFHAQTDPRTNQWAADLIGKGTVWRQSQGENVHTDWNQSRNFGDSSGTSSSSGGNNYSSGSNSGISYGQQAGNSGGSGANWSVQEQIDYAIQPSYFTTLRKSGGTVDALLFQGGKPFRHSGATWLPVSFRQ